MKFLKKNNKSSKMLRDMTSGSTFLLGENHATVYMLVEIGVNLPTRLGVIDLMNGRQRHDIDFQGFVIPICVDLVECEE
jgi:hypothetical protein